MAGANNIDRNWLAEQVKKYASLRNRYDLYATWLAAVLDFASRRICQVAISQARAKEVASFAGKCVRSWPKIQNPADEYTDLCGGRMIFPLLSEVDRAVDWTRGHFRIDEANSTDKGKELKPREFGYLSVHLIVQIDPRKLPGELRTEEVVVVPDDAANSNDRIRSVEPREAGALTDERLKILKRQIRDKGPKLTRQMWDYLAGLSAEVQIRTMAQHAWSDVGHDHIYKSAFELPAHAERQNAKIAALIEEVDDAFTSLVDAVRHLETNVGAYHDREETLKDIEQLEAILEHDAQNTRLAADLARRLISIGEYARAIEAAQKHYRGTTGDCPGLDICIGRARCRLGCSNRNPDEIHTGRELLVWVLRSQPSNVEAATYLAESYAAEGDANNALRFFGRAFKIDPDDPAALAGYLRHRIATDHNPFFASVVRPNIEAAISRCQAQVDVRVNLPHALFRMAEFHLLLCTPGPHAAHGAELFNLPPCRGEHSEEHIYEGLYSLCRAVSLTNDLALLETERDQIDLLVRELWNPPDSLKWAKLTLQLAVAAHPDSAKAQIDLPELLTDIRPDDPVLIIAGGCNESEAIGVIENRHILEAVIDEFAENAPEKGRAVVVCGGTCEGISGAVGEIGASRRESGRIRVVGYVPHLLPRGATRNEEQYDLFGTDGQGLSPLEAIQAWRDLLGAGVSPRSVKLVGINGGRIARFEYHLAAALAAVNTTREKADKGQVAVVRKSGRVADELMLVAEAPGNEYIQFLPADMESFRAFIAYPKSLKTDFDPEKQLPTLAEECEKVYKKRMSEIRDRQHAESIDDELKRVFGQSTLEQALHIPAKLQRIGKKAVFVGKGNVTVHPLLEEEIQEIAEIEHGRWVAERVRGGWKYGTERDDKKRIRPSIVSWKDLPQYERDKDIDHVKAIPEILAKIGYEIQPE